MYLMAATTVEQYPLDRNKIKKKVIEGMIGYSVLFLVLLVGSGIAAVAFKPMFWAVFLVILIIYFGVFLIELWYQIEYFKRYFYNVEPDFLVIKKGVILPHQTMLPYEKLQDVYMDQDILDRLFGLWDVHVSTATAMSGYAAHIDGVKQQNAEAIRKLILDKIRAKGVQNSRNV
jgi:membrane protein YdbS with pleckstrin-like domain